MGHVRNIVLCGLVVTGLIAAAMVTRPPVVLDSVSEIKPSVEIVNVTPLETVPRTLLASWVVTFPEGARMSPPVTHQNPRHVLVLAGEIRVISDDQVSRIVPVGEQITIKTGAWHTFKHIGVGTGRLLVSGVVGTDGLHDACIGP